MLKRMTKSRTFLEIGVFEIYCQPPTFACYLLKNNNLCGWQCGWQWLARQPDCQPKNVKIGESWQRLAQSWRKVGSKLAVKILVK
jgi:hypothetical protein